MEISRSLSPTSSLPARSAAPSPPAPDPRRDVADTAELRHQVEARLQGKVSPRTLRALHQRMIRAALECVPGFPPLLAVANELVWNLPRQGIPEPAPYVMPLVEQAAREHPGMQPFTKLLGELAEHPDLNGSQRQALLQELSMGFFDGERDRMKGMRFLALRARAVSDSHEVRVLLARRLAEATPHESERKLLDMALKLDARVGNQDRVQESDGKPGPGRGAHLLAVLIEAGYQAFDQGSQPTEREVLLHGATMVTAFGMNAFHENDPERSAQISMALLEELAAQRVVPPELMDWTSDCAKVALAHGDAYGARELIDDSVRDFMRSGDRLPPLDRWVRSMYDPETQSGWLTRVAGYTSAEMVKELACMALKKGEENAPDSLSAGYARQGREAIQAAGEDWSQLSQTIDRSFRLVLSGPAQAEKLKALASAGSGGSQSVREELGGVRVGSVWLPRRRS